MLTTEFRAFLQRLDNAELGDDVGEEEEQGRVLILQFVLDVRLGEITKITFICIILKEKIVWPGKKKKMYCNSPKKFVCVAFLFMRDY